MKKIFTLLLLLPLISAQNISINYNNPSYAGKETEFFIELINFPIDNYDLKIDILQDGKRIGRIFNEGVWKSTNYYINDAIESSGKFYLNFSETGEANITIKLRSSDGKIYAFENYTINILEYEEKNILKSEEENNKKADYYENPPPLQTIETKNNTFEVINLNPKTIKTKNNSKDNKDYAKYALALFCVLIITLYSLKFKKNKNEFG